MASSANNIPQPYKDVSKKGVQLLQKFHKIYELASTFRCINSLGRDCAKNAQLFCSNSDILNQESMSHKWLARETRSF